MNKNLYCAMIPKFKPPNIGYMLFKMVGFGWQSIQKQRYLVDKTLLVAPKKATLHEKSCILESDYFYLYSNLSVAKKAMMKKLPMKIKIVRVNIPSKHNTIYVGFWDNDPVIAARKIVITDITVIYPGHQKLLGSKND